MSDACLSQHTYIRAGHDIAKTGFRLTPNERLFFECLLQATREHGIPAPAGLSVPPSVCVVHYAHVKALVARRMLNAEEDTEEGRTRHRERVKSLLKRSRETLMCFKVVAVDAPFIWHTGKPVRGFAPNLTAIGV